MENYKTKTNNAESYKVERENSSPHPQLSTPTLQN